MELKKVAYFKIPVFYSLGKTCAKYHLMLEQHCLLDGPTVVTENANVKLLCKFSSRLTPPASCAEHQEKADEIILQDMIQVSLAEQKSHEEQEARENVALHDDTSIPSTDDRTQDLKRKVHREDEITDEVFELRRRAKGKNVEESKILPIPSPTRSLRNLSTLVSPDTETHQELTVTHSTPSSGSSVSKITKTNRLLFMPRKSSDQLANNLHDVMMETLPSLVKEKVTKQVEKEVPAQVRDQIPVYLAKGLIMERKTTKEETERLISKAVLQERGRMQTHISSHIQNAIDNAIPSLVDASPPPPPPPDDPHDDAHPKGENSAKRQKTSEYEAHVSGESSSGQVNIGNLVPD
ncbi:hypothetical protein Tco_0078902 [Tanacetum coccineum]